MRIIKSIHLDVKRLKNIELLLEHQNNVMEELVRSNRELAETLEKAWTAYEKLQAQQSRRRTTRRKS